MTENKRLVLITAVPTEETYKATYEIAAFKLLIQRFQIEQIEIPKRIIKFYTYVEGSRGGPYHLQGTEKKATLQDIRLFNRILTAKLQRRNRS